MLKASFILSASIAVAAAAGCGSSEAPGELRTSAQTNRFVADIAHGGSTTSWHLVDKPERVAARAWSERAAIADLSTRIRALRGAVWACDLVEGSVQIGFGRFTEGDRITVVSIARQKGAKPAQIQPMIADIVKIANPDLRVLSTTLCG